MKDRFTKYLFVSLGCIIGSCSINLFLVPNHFLSGGVSGIAIVFYYLFKFPIGLQIFLMNVPLLFAAYRNLGKEYTAVAIYGTVWFSIAVDATRFMSDLNIMDDPLLAAIMGGVVSGIGSGMIFRFDGSSGGLDIVAAIVKKKYSLNVGFVSFALNCVIMVAAAALFGLKPAVLTLISMFVSANLTDKVVEGFSRKKTVYIVLDNTEHIIKAILGEVGRGATILRGEGAFTRKNREVIFVVVSLTQIAKIKALVNDADPYAFMIMHDAAEVMGRGFTLPGSRQL